MFGIKHNRIVFTYRFFGLLLKDDNVAQIKNIYIMCTYSTKITPKKHVSYWAIQGSKKPRVQKAGERVFKGLERPYISGRKSFFDASGRWEPYLKEDRPNQLGKSANIRPTVYLKPIELNLKTCSTQPRTESHFPSNTLAEKLKAGIVARAKSLKSIGLANNDDAINDLALNIEDLKSIIKSASKQTVSTLASIAAQQDVFKIPISEEKSLTEVFEDLLRQYLPPISSEAFCSIEPLFISELIAESRSRPFLVDSGKLTIESGNLFLIVEKNYSLPGLLEASEINFSVASDI